MNEGGVDHEVVGSGIRSVSSDVGAPAHVSTQQSSKYNCGVCPRYILYSEKTPTYVFD